MPLLRRSGYEVDDHYLTTRAETDAFRAEHGVRTTPQLFISGYADLRRFLGKRVPDPDATSSRPVAVLFGLIAMAIWMAAGAISDM